MSQIHNIDMNLGLTYVFSEWINGHRNSQQGRFLLRLIRNLKSASQFKRRLHPTGDSLSRTDRVKLCELTAKINQQLRTLQVFPQFLVSTSGWIGTWLPTDEGILGTQFGRHRDRSSERLNYTNAAISIVNVARENRLDRIRECQLCGDLFYASRSSQRFCKTSCQQRAFRSTPEFKSRRNKYMRTYRDDHTSSLRHEP